ncbi:hypothetical protein L596_023944 [Steinernema carpocapsae]|uniref:DUF7627 domain-containing protein n=1 Tax=Steinernema carpocapsae TaxID=34508 RepID=A0A4U5MF69_STECR|nr:hypothetical protein L596_023944 [Steinernema carpocapsae]
MMASLQSALGGPANGQPMRRGLRKQSPGDDARFKVGSCDELVERLETMNLNVDLSARELAKFLVVNLEQLNDEEMDRVADVLCNSAVEHGNVYCVVDLVLNAIKNVRFQDACAASLSNSMTEYFTQEEKPKPVDEESETEEEVKPELRPMHPNLPEFLANLLVANYPRPYHRAIDASNVILFTIVSFVKGWLEVLTQSREQQSKDEEDDEEDPEAAKTLERSALALVDLCNAAQRRLWLKFPELTDEIYLESKRTITESTRLSSKLKKSLLEVLFMMNSWPKAGVTNRASVQTQTC